MNIKSLLQKSNPLDGSSARLLPLARGQQAKVDAEDYEWAAQWKWQATKPTGYTQYAKRRAWNPEEKKSKTLYLHREIAARMIGRPLLPGHREVVDHISGDGLDNRRCNLRVCSMADNLHWSRHRTDGASRYRGVFPASGLNGKWLAQICVGEKDERIKTLGRFRSEAEAAQAYDWNAIHYHGSFARLNFPDRPIGPPDNKTRTSPSKYARIWKNIWPDLKTKSRRVSAQDLFDMRRLRQDGLTLKEIGIRFGLSKSGVCLILKGRRHGHIRGLSA